MPYGAEGGRRFLTDHQDELRPVATDRDIFAALESSDPVPDDRVERTLEQVETKVFQLEKPPDEYDPGAKKVLLTASEPLAYLSLQPMIERLRHDRRVRGIGLLSDNVAGQRFAAELNGFTPRRTSSDTPYAVDAMKMAADDPFDVALVPVDPRNSPNAASLYGAKSVFGAKKLYVLATGWVGVGSTDLYHGERAKQMDTIDGIFVNDDLAGRIVKHQLPDFPPDRIIATGTPIADAVDARHGLGYTQAGREKLGLADDEVAVLVSGHISPASDRPEAGVHPRISERTFEQTIGEMVKAAAAAPERRFALVVRPHPRDPNREELLRIAQQPVPENLRVIDGSNDVVSMQEVTYGTDATASIVGTDNFLAPRRGRQGIFLGYEEPGMGGDLLKRLYGSEITAIIGQGEGITVARTPDEFRQSVLELRRAGTSVPKEDDDDRDSIDRMTEIMLRKE